MTGNDLLLALGRIDRKYIQEAEFEVPGKGNKKRLLGVVILIGMITLAGCGLWYLAIT